MALQFPQQQKTVSLLTKHIAAPDERESIRNVEKAKMAHGCASVRPFMSK